MTKKYADEYLERAHESTLNNEAEVKASSLCTCFYCGYQFDPNQEEDLLWYDETSPKGATAACPHCIIDCIIGDASGFPITELQFITACTEAWFDGYSRISSKQAPVKGKQVLIEVE